MAAPRKAVMLRVRGVVQGVGFRPTSTGSPTVKRSRGWVRNTSAGVEILAEGAPGAVDAFVAALPREAPPRAFIAELQCDPAGAGRRGGLRHPRQRHRPRRLPVASHRTSPTCGDCRRELLDPSDRRHGYPFTNCTNCGPRFTIIEDLPYDRERTTMRAFPLCPACRSEYEDPRDRRFHAEPNACPVCGPRARLLRRSGGAVEELAAGTAADPGGPIRAAAELLRRGEILAVKGLGGFHLACDATDGEVVRRLKAIRTESRP